jgi:multidrug efflux system membrane fusion protein
MSGDEKMGLTFVGSSRGNGRGAASPAHRRRSIVLLLLLPLVALAGLGAWEATKTERPRLQAAVPPSVSVSAPLVRQIAPKMNFLGQFSAVNRVELRAQVGGMLSEILFTDGQIVQKGDPLFVIDTRPFEIKLQQAIAAVQSAQARLELTKVELSRAQRLKETTFGTAQTVDQRQADEDAATAALATAQQSVLDARLDLEFAHIAAPFTGRMSNHLVSVGSLVSGSRGGATPTTLLSTIVSLDPIYLDFDMSESEFIEYQKGQTDNRSGKNQVAFHLSGQTRIYNGRLDFIDNAINRGSGTIHARAVVDNPGQSLVPGEFAELELTTGAPEPAYLVPSSAVSLDQSEHFVMTVAPDGTVVPKQVTLGRQFKGLQVVRSGLATSDLVIVDGLTRARPGMVVAPEEKPIHAPRHAARN